MLRNLSLIAVLVVGNVAFRQAPNGQPAAQQRMQKLSQELNLTEPQKEKIMPVLVEQAPKLKAVRENTSLTQQQKLSQLMQIRNETSDKIRPILTADQQKKLDEIRQQPRQQILQEMKAKRPN